MKESLDKTGLQPVVISEVLKRLMVERGVSVAGVMAGTGLTANPIYDLLNNKIKNPRYNTIKKIADFFGVSPSFLLYGEEFSLFTPHNQPLIIAQIQKEIDAYIKRSREPSYLSEERKRQIYDKYLASNRPLVFNLPSLEAMSPMTPEQVHKILESIDLLDRLSTAQKPEAPTEKQGI